MVPSNVDTDMQTAPPPTSTTDVSVLKDKEALSARVDDVVMTKAAPSSSTLQTTVIPAEQSTAEAQPRSEIDQVDKPSTLNPQPSANPVSETAPLQGNLHSDDEQAALPRVTAAAAAVSNSTVTTASKDKGQHRTPETEREQKPRKLRKGARPAADQDFEMNDSLPTPSPTDLDSRVHSEDKYRRLKRKLKEVLEENERLSMELERSNRRARNLRKEKNLLLDRLCTYERDSDSSPDTLSSMSSDSELSDTPIRGGYSSRRVSLVPPPPPLRATAPTTVKGHLQVPGFVKDTPTPSGQVGQHPKKTAAKPPQKRKSPAVAKESPSPAVASTITNVGSATQKPKRLHNTTKLRPSLNKIRKVQTLEKDENGNIKLPVTIGIITIMSIGHVIYDREAFHNERYIFPVGYKMSRSYNSMIDPHKQTVYTCSVIDDGDAPKFQIDAEDQPDKPIIAGTATGAWTHVVKAANQIRKRDHSNSASGPDYFGFSNGTIAKMIQDLPNVEKCTGYIMQKFEEPSAATSSKPEKRKASALDPSKSEADGDHDGEEDQIEDDEQEYATLGTPGSKKVKRSPSPKIRQAGFEAPKPMGENEDIEVEGVEEEEVDELEDEDDDVVSEMDGIEATIISAETAPAASFVSAASSSVVQNDVQEETPVAAVTTAPTFSDAEIIEVDDEVDQLDEESN